MRGVLIITGGSRGIGAATARLAAAQGWSLCASYVERAAEAEQVIAECLTSGAPAGRAVRAEVSDPDDVDALFTAAQELGPVRGLVNNAGIVAPQSLVSDMAAARVRRLLEVNVLGTILCAGAAVRAMTPGGGAIVNVSSRAAVLGSAGEYVDYAASKAAVDTFTVGLAREVAADGIRVNAVRPGLIRTDIHAAGGEPGRVDRLAGSVPMGRGGLPEEVAAAIVWLLDDAAAYVTGALVDVSGGR